MRAKIARRRAPAQPAPKAPPKRKKRRRKAKQDDELALPDLGPEPVQESLLHIAQDAVIILRRELQWKAQMAMARPGFMNMSDCIALLRLTTELGQAAMLGSEGEGQQANYERLSPEERVQLAALLLKVDYS